VKNKKEHPEHINAQSAEHQDEKFVAEDHNKEIEDLKKEARRKRKKKLQPITTNIFAQLQSWIIIKKRVIKEKTDIIKYGKEDIVKDISAFHGFSGQGSGTRHSDIQSFKDG